MVKTQYEERLDRTTAFLEKINAQIQKSTKAKSALTRSLSGESHHLRQTYGIVLPHLEDADNWHYDLFALVAALAALYPQPIRDRTRQRNFGGSCRGLKDATTSQGAERRLQTLLSLPIESLRFPLTDLVRQMKSKGVTIDYSLLLADLIQWGHPAEYIQDRWARSFHSTAPVEETSDENSTEQNHD